MLLISCDLKGGTQKRRNVLYPRKHVFERLDDSRGGRMKWEVQNG
jgi:hypothetical protein